MDNLNQFYLNQEEPNRSCFLALRQLILDQDENIHETVKYGMPCFCYKNKMFCYLWFDKKSNEPYVLMVEGNLLNHPSLVSGNRARMKIYPVNPTQDLSIEEIQEVLEEGLNLYRQGVVKTKG